MESPRFVFDPYSRTTRNISTHHRSGNFSFMLNEKLNYALFRIREDGRFFRIGFLLILFRQYRSVVTEFTFV